MNEHIIIRNHVRGLYEILDMIKFQHTVFALPFALASLLVAEQGIPRYDVFVWVLIAMIGARSSAMAFNRIVDISIDAANPRTMNRALPAGRISLNAAWFLAIFSIVLFFISAYMLNMLAFALSPIALAIIISYSYSKRFTCLSHLWLGASLGIAPVGAWVAAKGDIGFASILLGGAVAMWTAGFDIIYSLQDIDFDREKGLHSIPAKLGAARALLISRILHGIMVVLLTGFGIYLQMSWVYYVGVILIGLCLVYEHYLVTETNLKRINEAFFTVNGFVSIAYLIFVLMDVLL